MQNKIALVDGDWLLYRIGFACNEGPVQNALHTIKLCMRSIRGDTGATEVMVFFTSPTNFRRRVARMKGYKANRKDNPKPIWMEEMREYFHHKEACYTYDNIEADDAIIRWACMLGKERSIVIGIDKDFMTAPVVTYDPYGKVFKEQTVEEAPRELLRQCLKGDTADNIPSTFFITGKKCYAHVMDTALSLYEALVKEGIETHEAVRETLYQMYLLLGTELTEEEALDKSLEVFDLIYIHQSVDDIEEIYRRYGN